MWCETVGCDLPERLVQVARAHLAGVGDQAQQAQAHRIGERGEHLREILGVGLGERAASSERRSTPQSATGTPLRTSAH